MKIANSKDAGNEMYLPNGKFELVNKYPKVTYSQDCKKMFITLESEYVYKGPNQNGESFYYTYTTNNNTIANSQAYTSLKRGDKRTIKKEFELNSDKQSVVKITLTDHWEKSENGESLKFERIENTFEINSSLFGGSFIAGTTALNYIEKKFNIVNSGTNSDVISKNVIDSYKLNAIQNNVNAEYKQLDFTKDSGNTKRLNVLSNDLVVSNFNKSLVTNNLILDKIDTKNLTGTNVNPFYHYRYCYEVPNRFKKDVIEYDKKIDGQLNKINPFWMPINIVSLITDLINVGALFGIDIFMVSNHEINYYGFRDEALRQQAYQRKEKKVDKDQKNWGNEDNNWIGYVGQLNKAIDNNNMHFFSAEKLRLDPDIQGGTILYDAAKDRIHPIAGEGERRPPIDKILACKRSVAYVTYWDEFLKMRAENIRENFFKNVNTPNLFTIVAQEVAAAPKEGEKRFIELVDGKPKYPTPILNFIVKDNDVDKLRELNLERGGFATGIVFLVIFKKNIHAIINFKVDDDNVYPPDDEAMCEKNTIEINRIARYLYETPSIRKIEIQGHTSTEHDEPSNQGLSERRAFSVYKALRDHIHYGQLVPSPAPPGKAKITEDRLRYEGCGERFPAYDDVNTNDKILLKANKEKNRRVEFVILETDCSL